MKLDVDPFQEFAWAQGLIVWGSSGQRETRLPSGGEKLRKREA